MTLHLSSRSLKRQRPPLTQRCRRQYGENNGVGGSVPLEHLALDQRFARFRPNFLSHLFLCLTKGQRLGLGKKVGKEDTVVLRVCDGIVRGGGREKVGRDHFGALVQKLIERVLTVSSWCTPYDGLYAGNQICAESLGYRDLHLFGS